jgi:hypothetical protein
MYILARVGLDPAVPLPGADRDGPSTQPRLVASLILVVVGTGSSSFPGAFGLFSAREGRAITEMARLCTGFLSLLIGFVLMFVALSVPYSLSYGAWTWPLATCFAEPVYSGACGDIVLQPTLLYCCWILGSSRTVYLSRHKSRRRVAACLVVLDCPDRLGRLRSVGTRSLSCSSLPAFATLLGVKRMRVVPIEDTRDH